MTQEEFNALMDNYLAEYLSGGYFTSKYSAEEMEALLDQMATLDDIAHLGNVSRPSLLDNGHFADPIDQRGGYLAVKGTNVYRDSALTNLLGTMKEEAMPVVEVAGTYAKIKRISDGVFFFCDSTDIVRGYVGPCYGIDRWWIGANMVLLIEGDEIVLKNTGTSFGVMHQFTCENNMLGGQCCTGSALINDQLLSFRGEVAKNPSTDTYVGVSEQIDAGYIEYWSRADKKEVWHFIVNAGKEMRIKAAKLEPGSTQTIAHRDEDGNWVLNDPPPDKATELAKCQRYFYAFDFTDWPGVGTYWGRGINSTEIEMYNLTFPVTMRVNPALSDLKIYEAESGTIYDVVPNSHYQKKEGLRCLGVSSGMTVREGLTYIVIAAWFSADL